MLGPVGDGRAGLQGILEPPVGPLNHAVALRVVGRGGVVVGADDLAGAGPQGGGELGPLVQSQVSRHAEAGHPLADEGIPAGLLTMSTWMCKNCCWGTEMGCTAVLGWLVNLALEPDW